jgi:hypothetical protein
MSTTLVKLQAPSKFMTRVSIPLPKNHYFHLAAGKECEVHDFVIAPTTLECCQTDRRFKNFVIETALDSVEAQRQCRLDRSFTLPKLKFKGPGGSPPLLAVKGGLGSKVSSQNERMHLSNFLIFSWKLKQATFDTGPWRRS